MRERTTWDRNEIARQAAGHAPRRDPYEGLRCGPTVCVGTDNGWEERRSYVDDEDVQRASIVVKAARCVHVARCVLPNNVSEDAVEEVALHFMNLTVTELAAVEGIFIQACARHILGGDDQ